MLKKSNSLWLPEFFAIFCHRLTAAFGSKPARAASRIPISSDSDSAVRLLGNSSASFGLSRADDDTRYGLRSDAAVFEVSHKREKFSASASFGQLYEYGSLFGGSRGGPFSVDDTLTFAFGLSGSYQLAPGIRVIGNYAQGYSQVDSDDNAIVSDFSSHSVSSCSRSS